MVQRGRFDSAAGRFKAFFDELRGAFVERDDLLHQVALALLAREHVLITGPPGTAKSQIASRVLGRILSEDTGMPSVYARQITESTVQTDLIGPIDFKHLTETGRTRHFTDEGLLGSVHAFLDEVFDGRDMLLRSALNVLQERELKQGGTITKGQIECAVMTSNRYISDVLSHSRETLLAFVDRIGFISFVPRGFANPDHLSDVLRRNVGGDGKPRLDALLTIQDIDVLQAATEEVFVAPEICDALASFLRSFESGITKAVQADPEFVPTRYLSTRTAVRCGHLLRSAAIYDKIFKLPAREDAVTPTDFASLRLHLLLSGPTPENVNALLARELDPVEKRQLRTLRTEREIFDDCLSKVKFGAISRREAPQAASAEPEAPRSTRSTPPDEIDRVDGALGEALSAGKWEAVLAAAKEAVPYAREGAPTFERAKAVLDRATRGVGLIALKETFGLASPDASLLRSIRGVVDLARALENGSAAMHPTARWMNLRALELIYDAMRFAAGNTARSLEVAAGPPEDPMPATQARLEILRELADLRSQALAQSAAIGPNGNDDEWRALVASAADTIASSWARWFAIAISSTLQGETEKPRPTLAPILAALEPELRRLDEVDQALAAIAGASTRAKQTVAGPHIARIVRAAILGTRTEDRRSLIDELRSLEGTLRANDLGGAVNPEAWLEWTAKALLREEGDIVPENGARSFDGYRALRARERRVSISSILAEVAMLVGGPMNAAIDANASAPTEAVGRAAALASRVPEPIRASVIDADLSRVDRAVRYLRDWFGEVSKAPLAEVAHSRVYHVLWDEEALARFTLEVGLIAEMFPGGKERAQELKRRMRDLNEMAKQRANELFRGTSAQAWGAERGS